MSTPLPVLDAEHPWPGLFPYSEDAHAFFNGRERETLDLLRLVRRENCCLLYGQSGLGKSSLLRAGLFPCLREEGFLPVYLRLDFRNPQLALREQVGSLLGDALARARIDARRPAPDESLWAYFHASDVEFWDPDNRMITPVLVFDQFEELVQASEILAMRPLLAQFMAELADLVEGRIPVAVTARLEDDPEAVSDFEFNARRFRVVIGFREDFLPDLEEHLAAHQVNAQSRLRIAKMREDQALAAVQKTGGRLVDPDVARRIVAFVSGSAEQTQARLVEIEPALLSVVCFELNNRRLAERASQISAHLLAGAQEQIIEEFYQRSLADQDEAVAVFIEQELLTESGYRDSCAVEDAVSRHGIRRESLQVLVERRLLRLEERFGVLRVELTHDVLAPVARVQRDTRQAAREQRAQREREAARLRRTRRIMWSGGAVAAAAVSLVAVFYGLFRQAEAEKARVIEAQSNLMLSRANAAHEQGIPGEPFQFLVRALDLNPGNEGAAARLAALSLREPLARQHWALPLTLGGDGFGALDSLGEDRFLLRRGNAFTLTALQSREGRAWPDLGCLVPAEGRWQWKLQSTESAPRARPGEGSRVADTDWDMSAVRDALTAWSGPCKWKPPARGKATLPVGLEPDAAFAWISDGSTLERVALAGTAAPERLSSVQDLQPWQSVRAGREATFVLLSGEDRAALFWRPRPGQPWSRRVTLEPGARDGAFRAEAVFDSAGRHVLLSEPGGQCSLWEGVGGQRLWRRPCAPDGHRFHPTRPWLLLQGHARELSLLDITTGAVRATLATKLDINHLALSPDGQWAVVSSQDSTATVLRLPDLVPAAPPLRHEGAVVESGFMPDGIRLVTAAFDGAVRVWAWERGIQINALVHRGPVLFARPALDGTHVLTMADDRILRLWRLPAAPAPGAGAPRWSLHAVSPDGRQVAYVAEPGGALELAPLRATPSVGGGLEAARVLQAAGTRFTALAWGAGDRPRLAAATEDGAVLLYDPAGGKAAARLACGQPVRGLALAPDGRHVACQLAGRQIRIIEVQSGRASGVPVEAAGAILDWRLMADGRTLGVASTAGFALHDLATGYPVFRKALPGVLSASLHPARPVVAYTTVNGWGLWQPEEEAAGRTPQAGGSESGRPLRGARYSPDGELLALHSLDGRVQVVRPDSRWEAPILRHNTPVVDLGFSQDGRWLATTTLDGRVRVWDYRSGQVMAEDIHDPASGRAYELVGRGTWALGSVPGAERGRVSPRLLGLGANRPAPDWLVPSLQALTAVDLGSQGSARRATERAGKVADDDWWEAWMAYVLARNGVKQ